MSLTVTLLWFIGTAIMVGGALVIGIGSAAEMMPWQHPRDGAEPHRHHHRHAV